MEKINEKALTASIIFLAINILFLFSHFTWWGCVPVVGLVLYYYLRKGHLRTSGEINSDQGIAAWLGLYLGSTMISVIIISALYAGFLPASGFAAVTNDADGLAVNIVIIVVTFVAGLFLAKGKQNLVKRLLRYVLLLVAAYLILQRTIGVVSQGLIYGAIAFLVISLVIEYCVNEENDKNSVILYIFLLFAFLVVDFLCLIHSEYIYRLVDYCVYSIGGWDGQTLLDTIQNGASDSVPFLIAGRLSGWQLLSGALIFSAGGVFSFVRRNRYLEITDVDIRAYTALASFLLLTLSVRRHSTANNLAFYLLYMAYTLFGLGLKRKPVYVIKMAHWRSVDLNNIQYLVGNIIIVLAPVAYFHGALIKFVCLAAIPLGTIQFLRRDMVTKEVNTAFWKRRGFWLYLVLVSVVYAVASIWVGAGDLHDYVILAVILFVVIAGVVVTNIQNPRMYKNRFSSVIVIAVLAVIVLIFKVGSFSRFGEAVEHSADVTPEYMEQIEAEPEPTPEPITWQEAYLQVLDDGGISNKTTCTWMYIDNDTIPELWINADDEYGWLVSFYNEEAVVNELRRESFSYIPRSGLVHITSTEEVYDDDEYFTGYCVTDVINQFKNGDFLVSEHGEYQATDEWYRYSLYWNDAEVSEEDYDWYLADCFSGKGDVFYPAGDLTVADVMTILKEK